MVSFRLASGESLTESLREEQPEPREKITNEPAALATPPTSPTPSVEAGGKPPGAKISKSQTGNTTIERNLAGIFT